MNRSLATLALFSVLALASTGCGKLLHKDTPDAAAATVDTTTPTAEADAAVAETADAAVAPITTTAHNVDNIPQPQEPEVVAADITRTNYKAELDRLEKEVDSEK